MHGIAFVNPHSVTSLQNSMTVVLREESSLVAAIWRGATCIAFKPKMHIKGRELTSCSPIHLGKMHIIHLRYSPEQKNMHT